MRSPLGSFPSLFLLGLFFLGLASPLESRSECSLRLELPNIIGEMVGRVPLGVGPRRFVGSAKPDVFLVEEALAGRKFHPWGLQIFVQPDFDSIRAHDARQPNRLYKGVYLLGDPREIEEFGRKKSAGERSQHFTQLAEQSNQFFWVVGEDLQSRYWENVQGFFSPESMQVIDLGPQGAAIYQRGWTYPSIRGILRHSDTKGSRALRRVRSQSRGLAAEGFRLLVNRDFESCLERVALQTRVTPGPTSFSEQKKARLREWYRSGQAYCFELVAPDGESPAGLVGRSVGSLLKGESIYYNHIDLAKIVAIAIADFLHSIGIEVFDTGMVTNFSGLIRAKEVSQEVFDEHVDPLIAGPALSFPERLPLVRSQ